MLGMPKHETDTVLSPSRGTVRARCRCGWSGGEKKIADVEFAFAQEADHLVDVLHEAVFGGAGEQEEVNDG